MSAFEWSQDKTLCEFSAYVAFNKPTNGQTDIKHKMEYKHWAECHCWRWQLKSVLPRKDRVCLVISLSIFIYLCIICLSTHHCGSCCPCVKVHVGFVISIRDWSYMYHFIFHYIVLQPTNPRFHHSVYMYIIWYCHVGFGFCNDSVRSA